MEEKKEIVITEPCEVSIPKAGIGPEVKAANAYHCIENKKSIVAFKPGIVIFFMMIPVQAP